MNWHELEPRAIAVRESLIGIMERMLEHYRSWELAEPEPSFHKTLDTLQKPEYHAVVCGEVKRGKSSFINALLGQELLPTDVHVATCQVFCISHAETESFALIFEDGQREPIGRDDLVKYGSQRDEDLRGDSLLQGRRLRWIEVNVPAAFLPPGVHLLDTPGLGAIYAGHAEITQRWVTQADIVIFVLDSGQPLLKTEEEFLRAAYTVTQNILYVQTKIDTKDEAAWQSVHHRHEELLNQAFPQEDRSPLRVYPVACPLLLQAGSEADATERGYLLADSRFEDVRQAFQAILYRAVGWTRSAWAASASAKYHGNIQRFFAEQQKLLSTSSAEEQNRIQADKKALQAAFLQDWGSNGAKRLAVRREVETISSAIKQEAMQLYSGNSSPVYKELEKEINALTPSNCDTYVEAISGRVAQALGVQWQQIAGLARKKLVDTFADFETALGTALDPGMVNEARPDRELTIEGVGFLESLKAGRWEAMFMSGVGSVGANVLIEVGVITGPVGIAIASLVVTGLGVWGLVRGWRDSAKKNAIKNRQAICTYTRDCILECRHQMLEVDIRAGRTMSPVDEYIKNLKESCLQSIDETCERKKVQMINELEQLERQAALVGEERKKTLATVNERMEAWKDVGGKLQVQVNILRQMQQELASV